MSEIVKWYIQHKDLIDLVKDIVFFIGATATFISFYQFIKFLIQRKIINKRQEMDNDLRLYNEIHVNLKEFVDSYNAKPNNLRDIGVRLLYIKNYPYKLDNDGYRQMLYYYFMSENHKASGYVSGKGLYVLEHLWYYSEAIYYNSKNKKWFIDKKGKKFKNYNELEHKQLVRRIPFSNIYGYDFNSDWADKGEPVFYTKYKYYKWRLFANDLEAVTIDQEHHLANKVYLDKKKRARKVRLLLQHHKNRIRGYFLRKKRRKS